MKYFILSLISVSLLTSCVEPEYYDAGYYHSAPPRAEIYGYDERPHDYRHPYHGHREHRNAEMRGTHFRHDRRHQDHKMRHYQQQTLITTSGQKEVHTRDSGRARRYHGQQHDQKQVLTHSSPKRVHINEHSKSRVVQHPSENGSTVIVQHN